MQAAAGIKITGSCTAGLASALLIAWLMLLPGSILVCMVWGSWVVQQGF